LRGGTFTLTNHGTGGSLVATPIINQPQTGILGVGAIVKRPVVRTTSASLLPSADDAHRHPPHVLPELNLRPSRARRRAGGRAS
jgi:hypothetical protein